MRHQSPRPRARRRQRFHWDQVTRRGWYYLTIGCCLIAFGFGTLISAGDNPCTWTGVECVK